MRTPPLDLIVYINMTTEVALPLLLILLVTTTSSGQVCSRPHHSSRGLSFNVSKRDLTFPVGYGIKLSCEAGFNLDGPSVTKCLPNGEWCGPLPTCEAFYCKPFPETLKSGQLVFQTPWKAKFVCDDDYSYSKVLQCMSTGKWDGEPPVCIREVTCQSKRIRWKDTLRFSQSHRKTAQMWFTSRSSSYPKHISDLAADGQKSQLSNQCSITRVGDERNVGSINPRWVVRLPKEYFVRGIRVYGLTSVSNKNIKPSIQDIMKNLTGFQVKIGTNYWDPEEEDEVNWENAINCSEPKILAGEKTENAYSVVCNKRGTYVSINIPEKNRTLALCEVEIIGRPSDKKCFKRPYRDESQSCPDPGEILNGYRSGKTGNTTKFKSGQKVYYECHTCYTLHGSNSLRCGQDGKWHYQTFPRCLRMSCSSSPSHLNITKCDKQKFNHGRLIPEKSVYSYNDTLAFRCHEGYHLKGQRDVACRGQCQWSAEWPRCFELSCPIPQVPKHGSLRPALDVYRINSTVTFMCNYGYRMQGEDHSRCLSNTEWNTTVPKCIEIKCLRPQLPKDVIIVPEQQIYFYKSSVNFRCAAESHLLSGETNAFCNESGLWSSVPPTCKDQCNISCPCQLKRSQKGCNCVCKTTSDCRFDNNAVCGSDGNTYRSHCHLHVVACKKNVTKVADKPCNYGGVCSERKPTGECDAHVVKWYYNKAQDKCARFWYGSCYQGHNVFNTRHDCYHRCQCNSFCSDEVDEGLCAVPQTRFTFQNGSCQKFTYKGCFGNDNNFVTKRDCKKRCKEQTEIPLLSFQECGKRHKKALRDVCNSTTATNDFLVTVGVKSSPDNESYIVTVKSKFYGPKSVQEGSRELLLLSNNDNKCPCKDMLINQKYLVSGRTIDNWLTVNKTDLIYPYSIDIGLRLELKAACPNLGIDLGFPF